MPIILKNRLHSIDILRGIIILIMIVDHVRERFFMHVRVGDPISDSVSTELFLTRYLTHFCAPLFLFLTGLSAWLYAHQNNNHYHDPTGFLLKRGLVLIAFEVILYNLLWVELGTSTIYLQVLWAIGVSMIALGLIVRLNIWMIGGIGLLILLGHNALTPVSFEKGGVGFILWSILHENNDLFDIAGITIRSSYPVLSWMAVLFLGYFAGPLFSDKTDKSKRIKYLLSTAAICFSLMLVLRYFNLYGETLPWEHKAQIVDTLRSFFNFSKYPASLLFILTTLSIGFVMLVALDSINAQKGIFKAIKTIGSVPMLAYFLHLYALLVIYWICYWIVGPTQGTRFGFDYVWQIWLGALVLSALIYYPLERFSKYKHKHKHQKPWLSYL